MRPHVSLCVIVKNEEANLPACLASAADLVDEIIVVDTGSTDRTREVAASWSARVIDFPWVDSFAAARNECLRHATGDWIFWLDADDAIDEANREVLRQLFAHLDQGMAAYMMRCLCLSGHGESKSATMLGHARLFRNHPDVRWKFRVHEQILPSVVAAGGTVRWSDVVIRHMGYEDTVNEKQKHKRNLRLLHMENHEHPDDGFVLFYLGWTYLHLDMPQEALPMLWRSVSVSAQDVSYLNKLYFLLAKAYCALGQKPQAVQACRQGRALFPDDMELLYQEGMLLFEAGELPAAEACLARLLQIPETGLFGAVDPELRGWKVRQALAAIYHDQRRLGEAEMQWRAVIQERPDHTSAWLGLADLLIAQNRWDEVTRIIRELETDPHRNMDARLLQGLSYLAQRDFNTSLQILEDTCTKYPQAVMPRVLLAEVQVQAGRDMVAIEAALHRVLELAPHHPQTRARLEAIEQQRGRISPSSPSGSASGNTVMVG
jgi:glycosyltransferase involved in cell wall biosynthesis